MTTKTKTTKVKKATKGDVQVFERRRVLLAAFTVINAILDESADFSSLQYDADPDYDLTFQDWDYLGGLRHAASQMKDNMAWDPRTGDWCDGCDLTTCDFNGFVQRLLKEKAKQEAKSKTKAKAKA